MVIDLYVWTQIELIEKTCDSLVSLVNSLRADLTTRVLMLANSKLVEHRSQLHEQEARLQKYVQRAKESLHRYEAMLERDSLEEMQAAHLLTVDDEHKLVDKLGALVRLADRPSTQVRQTLPYEYVEPNRNGAPNPDLNREPAHLLRRAHEHLRFHMCDADAFKALSTARAILLAYTASTAPAETLIESSPAVIGCSDAAFAELLAADSPAIIYPTHSHVHSKRPSAESPLRVAATPNRAKCDSQNSVDTRAPSCAVCIMGDRNRSRLVCVQHVPDPSDPLAQELNVAVQTRNRPLDSNVLSSLFSASRPDSDSDGVDAEQCADSRAGAGGCVSLAVLPADRLLACRVGSRVLRCYRVDEASCTRSRSRSSSCSDIDGDGDGDWDSEPPEEKQVRRSTGNELSVPCRDMCI